GHQQFPVDRLVAVAVLVERALHLGRVIQRRHHAHMLESSAWDWQVRARAQAPQLAGFAELDSSQLTNRNPPGASNFGSPGPGRICSCNSSILFLEQSQHASVKSPSRRVLDNSITCTMALSVMHAPFLYRS